MLIRTLAAFLLAASAFSQSTTEAPPAEAHYPRIIRAELPLYPPIAWTAHISGTAAIQVTVQKGAVVDAQVKSSSTENQVLSLRSVENVKTWQFQPDDNATFLVTYVYKIAGEQTRLPENPKVELDLPRLVKVTARPFKPTCSDCEADISGKPIAH
jgi:Gram-negative bacterial TonB protein C-terminal